MVGRAGRLPFRGAGGKAVCNLGREGLLEDDLDELAGVCIVAIGGEVEGGGSALVLEVVLVGEISRA